MGAGDPTNVFAAGEDAKAASAASAASVASSAPSASPSSATALEEEDLEAITFQVGNRDFGRYRLLERLGAGGMADVFLALAQGPFDAKKLVVLKQPRAFAHDFVDMFMDEARLAMRLNHPNVVQTHDVGVNDGAFFLAMEYLEGQPLNRVLTTIFSRGEHLSHAHLARITSEALAGLHYAHTLRDYDGAPLNIVHRDVSPQNLFVTYDGQVKVVDFGIAKASVNLTQTSGGALKGKVAYMAPEQAAGQPVDARSDVYAMGIVLWEMVARRRLIKGISPADLLNHMLTMEIPLLSSEVPDVHPMLESAVMRALLRDPSERFQTALEMREALEAFMATSTGPVRATELGRITTKLFEQERALMETKIRAHMRPSPSSRGGGSGEGSIRPTTGSEPTKLEPLAASGSNPSLHGNDNSDVRTGMPVVASTASTETMTIARDRRSTLTIVALIVSVLALSTALIVVVRNGVNAQKTPQNAGVLPPPSVMSLTPAPSTSDAPPLPPPPPSSSTAITPSARPSLPVWKPHGASSARGHSPAHPIDTSFPR